MKEKNYQRSPREFDELCERSVRYYLTSLLLIPPLVFLFLGLLALNPLLLVFLLLFFATFAFSSLLQTPWPRLQWLLISGHHIIAQTPGLYVLIRMLSIGFGIGVGAFYLWLTYRGASFTFGLLGAVFIVLGIISIRQLMWVFRKNRGRFIITLTPQALHLQAADAHKIEILWTEEPRFSYVMAGEICIEGAGLLFRSVPIFLLPIRAAHLEAIIDYYREHPESRWELADPAGLDRVIALNPYRA